MLYLAEVKKQKSGFMGSETKLKLLAYQRNDQSWVSEQGEDLIAADQAGNFGDGALVMVNLDASRKIQNEPQPAGNKLVANLQQFSRQLEKLKGKEEEIEDWKQSLTVQSNELNRREMEMEARWEELDNMEEELQFLEQQRQETEAAKAEFAKLQEEAERNRLELEGAWEHLRGEQTKLEDLKTEVNPGGGLDEEQVTKLQELITNLESTVASTDDLSTNLNATAEAVHSDQVLLDSHIQQMEEQKNTAEQQQAEVAQQAEEVQQRQRNLQSFAQTIEQIKRELDKNQHNLAGKKQLLQTITEQLALQQQLYASLNGVNTASGNSSNGQVVDIEALENMPLEELQAIVDNLQQELETQMGFVKDQEEELTLELQDMDKLKQQIEAASEYDRLHLEPDLSDAQDRYRMLDETLVGQRRTLREREAVFHQHLRVLRRRQGVVDTDAGDSQGVDLRPMIAQLSGQIEGQQEKIAQINQEIAELEQTIAETSQVISQKEQEYQTQQQELQEWESKWQQQQLSLSQLWARIEAYKEILHPHQENLNQACQQLENIIQVWEKFQQAREMQMEGIKNLQHTVTGLVS